MTDVFEQSDLQRLQNALNEANGELNKQKIKEADIEKKDDQYNERLSTLTEPFAQELLRKPIEDAPKAVISGAKKAIGKGLNYVKGEAEKQVDKRVAQLSERLGVPDLGEAGRSLLSGDFGSFLPKSSSLDQVAGKARATLSSFNEDGLSAINRARASGGNAPLRTSDEPTEVDAFTGKPVTPVVSKKKPLFDIAEDDDWTSDLYDKPITHTSRLFEDRPSVRLPDTPAPPSLRASEALPKTSSLESFLPLDKAKTDLGSVDFKFKRPVQPRVQPKPATAVEGDTSVLDQLAPMREAMKTPNAPLAQRNSAVSDLLAGTDEAPPAPAPKPTLSAVGGTQTEPLTDGQATDDAAKALQGGAKRVVSRDVTGAAEKAAAEKAAAKTAEKGVGSDIAEGLAGAAEGEAEAQGGLDPVSDIIALVAGLGTLFGGEFGKHHTITPEEVPTIASSQKGVY